jgi:hypothetical protein
VKDVKVKAKLRLWIIFLISIRTCLSPQDLSHGASDRQSISRLPGMQVQKINAFATIITGATMTAEIMANLTG